VGCGVGILGVDLLLAMVALPQVGVEYVVQVSIADTSAASNNATTTISVASAGVQVCVYGCSAGAATWAAFACALALAAPCACCVAALCALCARCVCDRSLS
jgi:hypothetical protein